MASQIHSPGLWTRDFILLSASSLFFLAGNATASFFLGLQIYDESRSTFLFAMFTVMTFLPRVIVPALMGPLLDRYAKTTVLRFVGLLYVLLFLVLSLTTYARLYHYPLYLFFASALGTLESAYSVCYQSIYPEFIPAGLFVKAYAMNAMITTVAPIIMLPLVGVIYDAIGIRGVVAVFVSITAIAAAACLSLRSVSDSPKSQNSPVRCRTDTLKNYARELAQGLLYIKAERAISRVAVYNLVLYISIGAQEALLLPFFAASETLSVTRYSNLMAFCTAGTLLMSLLFYKFSPPRRGRYCLLRLAYVSIGVTIAILVRLPYSLMVIAYAIFGMACSVTNNIRNSSIQAHIPSHMRGRFNGIFLMLSMGGKMLGETAAGALGGSLSSETILLGVGMASILTAFIILPPHHKELQSLMERVG